MMPTVDEGLTHLDRALWVVDHAVIADLPQIDESGRALPGTSQNVPGAGRLAHEFLTETIRLSPRGTYRRGLTVRLWLALLITVAFEGTAGIRAMHAFATGRLPRDQQWELGILTTHRVTRKPTMLTEKQMYSMADSIDLALNPFGTEDEAERAERTAILTAVTKALVDATLVVAPAGTSYAVDETGIWAWLKGKRRSDDVAPSDVVEALTPKQRASRKEKGVPDPEITEDEVEESQRLYGPKDEDVEPPAENPAPTEDADPEPDSDDKSGADDDVAPRRSSFDPFARWGAKTHKTGRVAGYYGYALHILVRVPDLIADLPPLRVKGARVTPPDALAGPHLIQEHAVTPASTDIVDVTLGMVRRIFAKGHTVGDFLGDRHYSYKAFDRWARVLWTMGVRPVLDMRKDNHGAFDYNGATVIDGTPHCGVPEGLKVIDSPGLNATPESWKEFTTNIDKRAAYAMDRHTTAWSNQGKTRWQCAALAGKVGCPRRDGTLETAVKNDLPIVEPPSTSTPWCEAQTAQIPAIKQMKYQQEHYWGNRSWRRSWARRTYVEGRFGTMKNHRTGNVHRGFMQLSGQPLVTLAITAAVVADNLRELENWYERASVLHDADYWAALRKGEKERAAQTRKRLAEYADHPLHQATRHQYGFTMLSATQQQELDATYIANAKKAA